MTSKQNNLGPLTFGLDIGIASVGWAVLGENRIVDLGVRCFDKAETAKEGESLNLARRTARLMRRRLRRRAWRLTKLARLLKREGLISDVNILKQQPAKGFKTPNLWKLRVEALDRKLEAEEWSRVIYHLCKHRGFHWISRAEAKAADSDSEGGKVKKGLAGTKKLMQEKNYRTAAEMVIHEFPDAQRNKQGDYSKALSRELLADELKKLFEFQRSEKIGNPYATLELEKVILGNGDKKSGLFWAQKPALAGKDLLKMLGHCTFEKEEYRAPKASFTAERHVWLTRLNNLRIVVDGKLRKLNEEERRAVLYLPYEYDTDFTFERLRKALVKAGLTDEFRFAGLGYPSERQKTEENAKDPEKEKLAKFDGWHGVRKALKKAGLESDWKRISANALNGNPELLDQIVWVLTAFKENDEIEAELNKLELPNKPPIVKALLEVGFKEFSNLSLKALRKIIPHMESGLRYDEACQKAGYHHSQPSKMECKYLPSLYSGRDKKGRLIFNQQIEQDINGGIPRNPVVLRALNQARKVVNALIEKYGSPYAVNIELARDLSKPLLSYFDKKGNKILGRKDIENEQKKYREKKESAESFFLSITDRKPEGSELLKMRLFKEQLDRCPYCGNALDINQIFSDGNYAQVDHVLPYSRSFDDSMNNKVVVHSRCNQLKGNRTPYEHLDGQGDSVLWREYVGFVQSNPNYRQAKRNRLLKKDFGEKEAESFRDRNLNDTRYICRFFKNYVERYLKLHEESNKKRCVVLSGQMTSFLRARWGLVKARGDSDRHHALDAVVVAAASHGMVKRLSHYSRRKELEKVREGFVDVETGEIVNPAMFEKLEQHFPSPWPHFRDELLARLSIDDPATLRTEMENLGNYPTDALETLRSLFVSRAPQRRNSGAAHKKTVYAQPESLKATGSVTQKVALANLAVKDFGKKIDGEWVDCKLIDPHRNEKLYAALQEWAQQREEREKRAKEIEKAAKESKRELTPDEKTEIERLRALPRKPDKEGNPTGPIVRTATKVIDSLSGIPIRGGIAKNDTMLRVDVFKNKTDNKFHLVPVYVHHSVKGLPNRAIVAFKDEEEWTVMDDGHEFLYSLHPNDYVRITQKNGESICGYYRGCHSGTAALTIALHDRYIYGDKTTSLALHKKDGSKPIPNDKRGLIEGIGVKLAANIEKLNIDVLGNIYPAPPETRRLCSAQRSGVEHDLA